MADSRVLPPAALAREARLVRPPIARVHGAWLLGALLALALVLRLWAVDWQLPAVIYYDELKYVLAPAGGLPGAEDSPTDYRNPSLLRHILRLEYRLLLRESTQAADANSVDEQELARRMVLGRMTAALFGAATVALLYFVGRRAFGPGVGFVAALLLAVNFLHVQVSHLSVNDVPATFFLVAGLLPAVALFGKLTERDFILAGLLAGLAAATKYNYGIVLLVPLAAWAWHAVRRAAPRDLLLLGPPLIASSALIGLAIGMPEIIWAPLDVLEGVLVQSRIGDRRWSGQASDAIPLLYLKTLVQAFGPPALLAALGGVALLARRRSVVGLALVACAAIYLAFMCGKLLFFARFALPLVPVVCLLAAYGLVAAWTGAAASRRRLALLLLAGVAVLGPPTYLSVQLLTIVGRPDTRVQAAQWLEGHVSPGTRIAAQSYSVPIQLKDFPLERRYELASFDLLVDEQEFRRLACAGHRYVLVNSYRWDRQRTSGRPGEPTGYEELARYGRVVATFRPGRDNTSVPLNIDDVALPFWYLTHYAQPGPTIRVYSLPQFVC